MKVILESLNAPIQKEIEDLWAEESGRRIDELNQGKVQAISSSRVFDELRERLK